MRNKSTLKINKSPTKFDALGRNQDFITSRNINGLN